MVWRNFVADDVLASTFPVMNVDSMRKIDRMAGVPLCFLMSILDRVMSFFRGGKPARPDTTNTLFVELSEMGSAIIVDPAMRKLQKEVGANLHFVIFKDNVKSLDILQTVPAENIFLIRPDNLMVLARDVVRFIGWCRKKRITTVIDLELFSRFTAMLCFFSGAKSRVGFASLHDEGLYRGSIINCPVRYNPHVHMAVNFISLVNTAMGKHENAYSTTPVDQKELSLRKVDPSQDAKDIVMEKIRSIYPNWNGEKILLFNVNASDLLPQRRWPRENYSKVASDILELHQDAIIVATGAPKERDYVQYFVDQVSHPRCVNSAGLFKFDELVPLYSISKMMITNDSGPAHFSAVTPLKVFVIFGPETPRLYMPIGGNAESIYLGLPCSPCVSAANHRKTSCETRPCITGIPTAMVTALLDDFLKIQVKSPEPTIIP